MTRPRTVRSFTRVAILSAVPLLAIIVAAFATRRQGTLVAENQHSHAQTAGGDVPQHVALTGESARRIGVTYAVVSEEPIEREIRVVGQIAPDETRITSISLKVDGWVERLYANTTGQHIDAGSPLMAVYSPMVLTAEEELLLAKRLVASLAGADSAPRAQASSMLSAARGRLIAWDVAVVDVERVEANARAERTITVRAPSSGFVIEKDVVEGQRVMAGDALYRLADLSRVWLEGDVYEQDVAALHVGQHVSAEVQALPGTTFVGRVTYVSPTLNAETRTARIRVELSNPGYRLKPGMVATLHLVARAQKPVLTIPRAAVLSTGERNLVFVKRSDGMLEPHVVTVGAVTDDRVAILRGLARGDSVVASATFLVDAESSLGTALGGMGNMPGMDIVAPRKKD